MPTSDDDLAKKQDDVEKLRQQLADEEAKQEQLARELSNDVTASQLEEEATRLNAEIAALKARNTKTAVKEGAAAVLDPTGTARRHEQAKIDAGRAPAEVVDSGAADETAPTKRRGGNS